VLGKLSLLKLFLALALLTLFEMLLGKNATVLGNPSVYRRRPDRADFPKSHGLGAMSLFDGILISVIMFRYWVVLSAKKDVDLLVEKNVIVNWLGSNAEVKTQKTGA
jgi:hypothetical protein